MGNYKESSSVITRIFYGVFTQWVTVAYFSGSWILASFSLVGVLF